MKVELSLSARDLKNAAGAFKGKSDPFAVVTHVATNQDDVPIVLGRTETIKNNLSPSFANVFIFDYELGTPVKVAVSLFDEVPDSNNIPMGCAVFEIGALLGARGGAKGKKLRTGGTLTAVIRKSQGSGVLRFKLRGIDLKNTEGFLRKSDPFFEVDRRTNNSGSSTFFTVFRSNIVDDDLSPEWKNSFVQISTLCGGNLDEPFFVRIYDHEKSGKHVLMGEFETTCNAMVGAAGGYPITVRKQGEETGKVAVVSATVSILQGRQANDVASVERSMAAVKISPSEIPTSGPETFVDYISGGCQLNVTVAIDFTGSNGDPRKPGTLHHKHKDGQLNDYEKAITAILGTLAEYDANKFFPVLGFGAKVNGEVCHAFQVGGSSEAHGVSGVLEAYRGVFKSGFTMSKPTVFNDVIKFAANRAEKQLQDELETGKQSYTILLLLTDGCVSDIEATAACLQEESDKPISIIIVGLGNADFSGMRFLDDLRSSGKRDIAQFVPFNQYSHSPNELARVTCKEIPDQLVRYFQEVGIHPNRVEEVQEAEIEVEEEEDIDLGLDFQAEQISLSRGGFDLQYNAW